MRAKRPKRALREIMNPANKSGNLALNVFVHDHDWVAIGRQAIIGVSR